MIASKIKTPWKASDVSEAGHNRQPSDINAANTAANLNLQQLHTQEHWSHPGLFIVKELSCWWALAKPGVWWNVAQLRLGSDFPFLDTLIPSILQ